MALKYPLVHELVIVIADLYLPEEQALDADALPGLERVARFGARSVTPQGWRAWLATAMGRGDLAAEPVARVAARCVPGARRDGFLWLATPLHLMAGLTRLHLEERGLLRLPLATLRSLAEDFHRVFHGAGFALEPLASGGFLVSGPAVSEARTIEPARCVGTDLSAALPAAPSLRTLGAEMEMWLNEHSVNLERLARAEPAISTLWLWGGGPAQAAPGAPAVPSEHVEQEHLYGSDPYLDGLAVALGVPVARLPEKIEVLLDRPARRLVVVVDVAEVLRETGAGSTASALAAIDARWILPATRLVARGVVRRLRLLANDRCLLFGRFDRLRSWRPLRRGLQGLT